MRIATIRSIIHPKVEGIIITDQGYYELPVNVDMAQARTSGDPKGFVLHEVAVHLAQCKLDTGIPLKEGLWNIHFSQWAQTNFNLPAGFTA